MSDNPLPPPPQGVDPETYKWIVKVLLPRVTKIAALNWEQVAKSGSSINDLDDPNPTDLVQHIAATTAHGATGDLVGTGDLATTSAAGVVKQSATLTALAASTVTASGSYTQAEVQDISDMAKGASDKLDSLISAMKTAGLME